MRRLCGRGQPPAHPRRDLHAGGPLLAAHQADGLRLPGGRRHLSADRRPGQGKPGLHPPHLSRGGVHRAGVGGGDGGVLGRQAAGTEGRGAGQALQRVSGLRAPDGRLAYRPVHQAAARPDSTPLLVRRIGYEPRRRLRLRPRQRLYRGGARAGPRLRPQSLRDARSRGRMLRFGLVRRRLALATRDHRRVGLQHADAPALPPGSGGVGLPRLHVLRQAKLVDLAAQLDQAVQCVRPYQSALSQASGGSRRRGRRGGLPAGAREAGRNRLGVAACVHAAAGCRHG